MTDYERGTGGLVFAAPLDIVLTEYDVVQPDVALFRRERRHVIDMMEPTRAVADLAVEVLSRTTEARDRGRKPRVLARFGLPEYWLVDPVANVLEICGGLQRRTRADRQRRRVQRRRIRRRRPVRRKASRRAGVASVTHTQVAMTDVDKPCLNGGGEPHYTHPMRGHDWIDRRSLALHEAVAAKLETDPQLLEVARTNLRRWLRTNPAAAHAEWSRLLDTTSLPDLLVLLRSPGDEAARLRQSSPFAGLLTPQERQAILNDYESRRA